MAVRALTRNVMRSALTCLGIIIGVSAVIAMVEIGQGSKKAVAATIREGLSLADIEEGSRPVALAFPWRGDPVHARLHALAEGLCAALPHTIAGKLPVVLLIDGDVGMSLGRIVRHEVAPNANVLAIDGVQLKRFDYVDIGRVVDLTNVVPVVIKSLLFK